MFDPFAGVGGNVVQFASTCQMVRGGSRAVRPALHCHRPALLPIATRRDGAAPLTRSPLLFAAPISAHSKMSSHWQKLPQKTRLNEIRAANLPRS